MMDKEEIINLLISILKIIVGIVAISACLLIVEFLWGNFIEFSYKSSAKALFGNDIIFPYIILPFLLAFIFMVFLFLIGVVTEVSEKLHKWYKELKPTWWMNLIVIYAFGWLLIYIIYFQINPGSW